MKDIAKRQIIINSMISDETITQQEARSINFGRIDLVNVNENAIWQDPAPCMIKEIYLMIFYLTIKDFIKTNIDSMEAIREYEDKMIKEAVMQYIEKYDLTIKSFIDGYRIILYPHDCKDYEISVKRTVGIRRRKRYERKQPLLKRVFLDQE